MTYLILASIQGIRDETNARMVAVSLEHDYQADVAIIEMPEEVTHEQDNAGQGQSNLPG